MRNNNFLIKGHISEDVEVDTIDSFSNKNTYLLNVVNSGALGDFENNLAIAKKINDDSTVVYFLPQKNNEGARISSKYVAYVRLPGYQNWGWFHIKDGKITDKLPGIDTILDSLRSQKRGKFSIAEKNGYISVVNDGKSTVLDYGNFITKYSKSLIFQNLEYKLYKLANGKLVVVSRDGDDLFKQKEGVYFLPPPGFDVYRFYNKRVLFDIVDSVSRLSVLPEKIAITSLKD